MSHWCKKSGLPGTTCTLAPGKEDHAAWTQAARAEQVVVVRSAAYSMSLVDLVGALRGVPHHVLVRGARRLEYSCESFGSRLQHVEWTGSYALRGYTPKGSPHHMLLTAGSAVATLEMRLVMIHIVCTAFLVAPHGQPIFNVDDMSVEAAGGKEMVVCQVATFTLTFCILIKGFFC